MLSERLKCCKVTRSTFKFVTSSVVNYLDFSSLGLMLRPNIRASDRTLSIVPGPRDQQ